MKQTRRPRPPKHPAYTTRGYIRISRQIKTAYNNGTPYPCGIAGPRCTKYANVAHHIIPVLQGGSWGTDNITPACQTCNNWIRTPRRKNKSFS